jgi:medium-chain acyl-[acyl-carrier-protein] hydrolase
MGAIIAFELTRWLRDHRASGPLHLIVSGRRGPQAPLAEESTYHLPHDEFIQRLRDLKGTSEEILAEPELLEIVLPVLRADFEVVQTYKYRPAAPIQTPITAFSGIDDNFVSRPEIEAWSRETASTFKSREFRGGHFFLKTAHDFLPALRDELQHVLLRS